MDNILLDFEQAKAKHLLFKSRLRSILYDIPVEEGPVLSQYECSVGKWIYSHALKVYGHIPEMHELEKVHAEIHISAKNLVELHKSGKIQEAKNGLSGMENIADKLVGLLTLIEKKLDLIPQYLLTESPLELKLDEYYDLLRSNAELDKRIRQQIQDSNHDLNRFETVLSALHEGIMIQDEKGILQVANQSARELLGLKMEKMLPSEAVAKEWTVYDEDGNIIRPEDYTFMRVIKTGLPQINQIMGVKRPDGSFIWLQVTAQPLIDKSSEKLTGVVSSFFDITEARKSTTALKESENRFRLLAEASPQMIFTSNITGEADYFNMQWIRFTGINETQLLNWGWTEVIHPEDLQKTLDTCALIRKGQIGGEFENRYKRSDGQFTWHLNRKLPIKNSEGEVQLWILSAMDIQDLKKLQEQKDDFISIASHELKTPITSLQASLQLLERMKDNPSPKNFNRLIEMANKSMEKVNVLIVDLLDASKFSQGQLHINKTHFFLSQLLTGCCDHVRVAGEYEIIVSGNANLEVYADPERIEQVVVNLVNNAIKYAPASKEIKIAISQENKVAKVTITDKGPGILPEKIPHLFERYYRVDTNGIQYSGLGLGLYISGEIIKKHGGQIGVESELGKGSSFWFTLPLSDQPIIDS